MTAAIFLLRAHGRIVGAALVAPTARYCSVRALDAERLDRRFATPADWKAIEAEVANLTNGPLPKSSAIARVLVADRGFEVRYLVTEDLAEVGPAEVAAALDARLRAQPFEEAGLRLRQKNTL